MAIRRRTVQPNIWQDTEFGLLSPLAQLIFVGLITQADDEGRLNGHPAIVSSMLFPYRTVALEEVMDALAEIERRMRNIIFYEVEGQMYIQFKNWLKHQTLREDRTTKSIFPPPTADNGGEMRTNAAQVSKVSKISKVSKAVADGGDDSIKIYNDATTEKTNTPLMSACDKVRAELEAKGILKKKTLI